MTQPLPAIDHTALLHTLPEAVIVIDADWRVLFINTAAADFFAVSALQVHGKSLQDWFLLQDDDEQAITVNMTNITKEAPLVLDEAFIARPGSTIPVAVTVKRLQQAETQAFVLTVHDRTKQHELSNLKSAFVSIVSHQLRTPLSAVKWTLESILLNRRKETLSDHQKDFLEQALESNERMISLVNDLLNVSQLENGKMETVPEPVTPESIVRTAVDDITMYAHANNVTLDASIDAALPHVSADPNQLQQVMQNLLSNAIKYSPGKSTVAVKAELSGPFVRFSIIDHGIGIPEDARSRLFEPFFRATNAISTKAEGSGLGLYIAKMVVELNGGRIWVESDTTGVQTGTTFHFTLPIDQTI